MKKKVLKLISLLLFIFIGVLPVKADDFDFKVGDAVSLLPWDGTQNGYYKHSGIDSGITFPFEGKNKKYDVIRYLASKDNHQIPTYCIDPNVQAKGMGYTYEVSRLLLNPKDSTEIRTQDAGLIAIIANGANQYSNTNDKTLYMATNIAVRAWVIGIYGNGLGNASSVSDGEAIASSLVNFGIDMASKHGDIIPKIIPKYSACTGDSSTVKSCYLNKVKGYSWFKSNIKFSGTSSILSTAESLIEKAFEAAQKEAEKDKNTTANVSAELTVNSVSDTEDNILVEFTIENLAEDGYVHVDQNVTCSDCAANGITIEPGEYGDGSNWNALASDTNIAEFINKKGVVYVRYVVKKESTEECKDSDFTLNYTVYNPNATEQEEYKGGMLYRNSGANENQRFIIIHKTSSGGPSSDDTEPQEAALGGKITCMKEKEKCDTVIESPICSNNKDEAVAKVTAPEDIKKCIIDNKDDADNTYELTTEDAFNGIENNYCSIFCKEDYEKIEFDPIIENVPCGGYFKLSAHVEGTKRCYTGSPNTDDYAIDTKQYEADLKEQQQVVANNLTDSSKYQAWNAAWEAAKNNVQTVRNVSCTINGKSTVCGQIYAYTLTIPSYSTFNVNEKDGDQVDTKNVAGTTVTFQTSCACSGSTCPVCPGPTDYSSFVAGTNNLVWEDAVDGDNNVDGDNQYIIHTLDEFINKATQGAGNAGTYNDTVNTANEEIVNIIKNYNACTTGWINDFKFGHQLEFEYSQYVSDGGYDISPQMPSYNDLFTNQTGENGNPANMLTEDGELEEKSEISICLGDVDTKYETCSTGWITIEEEQRATNEKYNDVSVYQSVFEKQNISICGLDESGKASCKDEEVPLSKAKFVRKVVEKKQDYISPDDLLSQVGTTGYVTDSDTSSNPLISFEGIEGLPTSSANVGGGKTVIRIYDLGEFYGDDKAGELGRLIDFNEAKELSDGTVAKALGETWASGVAVGDAGEYICIYTTACRPDDCPECEFICEESPDDDIHCELEECPACDFTCVNCLFNLDDLQVNNKVISPNEFASAGREMGYNWNVQTSLKALQLLSKKASVTINEITSSGETIYEYDSGDKTSSGSNLAFSLKMTPEVTSFIKEYNKEVDSSGMYKGQTVGKGYANNTLKCYSDTEKGFKNIYCFSTFIDELVSRYGSSITGLNNRPSTSEREGNPNGKNYWILWIPENSQYGVDGGYVKQECTKDLEGYPNCHLTEQIGGPAWK